LKSAHDLITFLLHECNQFFGWGLDVGPFAQDVMRCWAVEPGGQRFRHAPQVEAYLGLVPRERSSGETQRRGHITKAGHVRVRWLLIQAAVSIFRRRAPEADALRLWALPNAARRGKHVAVVALARRLAGILYALLRDGTTFDPRHCRPWAMATPLPA